MSRALNVWKEKKEFYERIDKSTHIYANVKNEDLLSKNYYFKRVSLDTWVLTSEIYSDIPCNENDKLGNKIQWRPCEDEKVIPHELVCDMLNNLKDSGEYTIKFETDKKSKVSLHSKYIAICKNFENYCIIVEGKILQNYIKYFGDNLTFDCVCIFPYSKSVVRKSISFRFFKPSLESSLPRPTNYKDINPESLYEIKLFMRSKFYSFNEIKL